MERILIKDLHEYIDKEVVIAGWVDVRRDHGKLVFVDLRDRSGTLQTVILPQHSEAYKAVKQVRREWVVHMKGVVNKRPEKMIHAQTPTGDIELEVIELHVLDKAQDLPFDSDAELNLDTELDYRPLTLRTDKNRAIFKVQAEIVRAYRDFLTGEDFVEFQAPKIVGDDVEGGGNVFKIAYLKDKDAFLATSPQLYKQIMVGVFERTFSIGNVFRAEKHSTTRHLNEYTSLDAEFGFIRDHVDVMQLETNLIRYVIAHLKETCSDAFAFLKAEFPLVSEGAIFPVLKLHDAQKLIKEKTGKDKTNEPDLEPEDERWLCEYAKEGLGSDFIFITHYPVSKRPFYTFEDPEDLGFTKSFDLLFRGVEITTGGQRVHDYDVLVEKIKTKGLDPEQFSFYLQAFKYGMPPHGGWGMGLERLTAKFLGLHNVREAALFPRDINRIDNPLSL